MANLIQIKRSTTNNAPAAGGIKTGELAYSLLNSSNSLFVGDTSNNAIRVGGGNYLWLHQSNTSAPGTLTANAVVIVNGNSFVSNWKSNGLTVGIDGESVSIANISTFANLTHLGVAAGTTGSNAELVTSFAVKTYVDARSPLQTNTFVSFGSNNFSNGGVNTFTFDSASVKLTLGNTSVNTSINSTSISTNTGTFTGTVNTGILNVSGVTASGNVTVTGFANVSSNIIIGGTANVTGQTNIGNNIVVAGTANVAGLMTISNNITATGTANVGGNLSVTGIAATGNTTITGFANVSSYINVVGAATVNGALTVNNTAAVGNTTVTGYANVSGNLNVSGDATVSGNLTVNGTLTTINTTNLNISDPLIRVANNNDVSDLVDIGLFGSFDGGAGTKYTGLFRDQTDAVYKLFTGLTVLPTTTVDTSNASFVYSTLQSYLKSGGTNATGLIANSTTIAITANSTLNVALVANTLTLSSPLVGTSGGTGLATVTAEDILVANATNGYRKLSIGSEGTVLQVSSGVVAYNTLDGGTF